MARRIKYPISKKKPGQKQVLPIKDYKIINKIYDYWIHEMEHAKSDIKKYQAHRNYILFLIGFNTAFRAEDLLQLRVCDVEKGYVSIKENKTGKMQNFKMNALLHTQIMNYIETYDLKQHDYLFMGQQKKVTYKGVTQDIIYPITKQNILIGVIPRVIKACGITFPFGLHSLRKTFGYQYIINGGNPMTLMKMYNHSDVGVTMRYVMWDMDDVEKERESIFIGKKVK